MKWIGILARAYAVLAAYLLAFAALIVGILLSQGLVTREKAAKALEILRMPPEKAPPSDPSSPEEAARRAEEARIARGDALDARERELQKLLERVSSRTGQLENERRRLESERLLFDQARAAAEKAKADLVTAESDAVMASNLPILSKMDGAGIVSVLRHMDDPSFVRYLRALKPSKAVEVLDAVRNAPELEAEFRRVPSEAPKGAKTRAELLMEEFKKASQG
jgi:DNA repair exonuclease SbcCD ATPase subunit